MFKEKARSCQVKQGGTSTWWIQFEKSKVNKSLWKENFRMSRESFYKLCQSLNLYLVKKTTQIPVSVGSQLDAFLYCINDEGCY